jgi:ferritin-like metal-binding protein YciE
MSLFNSIELNTMEDLFVIQIEDLYDAEKRIVEALPKMVDGASAPELRQALEQHLNQTRNHVVRLEQVFRSIGREAKSETCEAMKGLLKEGEEMLDAKGDPEVKDAALIAAAQRVEHYEISGYGTARTLAQHLDLNHAASLLEATLDEEKEADQKLTEIAESEVNLRASQ